ncbi:Protein kinase domain-containing protein [Plasmodiophora brassicae]
MIVCLCCASGEPARSTRDPPDGGNVVKQHLIQSVIAQALADVAYSTGNWSETGRPLKERCRRRELNRGDVGILAYWSPVIAADAYAQSQFHLGIAEAILQDIHNDFMYPSPNIRTAKKFMLAAGTNILLKRKRALAAPFLSAGAVMYTAKAAIFDRFKREPTHALQKVPRRFMTDAGILAAAAASGLVIVNTDWIVRKFGERYVAPFLYGSRCIGGESQMGPGAGNAPNGAPHGASVAPASVSTIAFSAFIIYCVAV